MVRGRESLLPWRFPYSAPSSFWWRFDDSKMRTLGSEEGKLMGRAVVGISTADKLCVSWHTAFCMVDFIGTLSSWSWHLIDQSKHVAVKYLNTHTADVRDGYSPYIYTHQKLLFLAHMTPEYRRVSRLRVCLPNFDAQQAFLFSRICREVLELTQPLTGGKSSGA